MASPSGAAAPFVGRSREVDRVASVVEAARDGRMTALLVSGDAGVGKTRLVERVCRDAATQDPDLVVLSGVCLPMGATTVPLMPIRTAVRRLPAGLRPPPLDGEGSGGAPVVVDEWLERTSRDHPVVLVVDDIQWADPGSLDVLTYVLAGPADRGLGILMTLRRDEVGAAGHALQRWLADVRRMPCLTELSLGAFDRTATREQLQALLGSTPHESLVTEVLERTRGNAYLNRLLVEDLGPDARHLGPGLPDDLRGAVLRPWHRLSAPARELVLAVAVGGEVATGAALRRAASLVGSTPEEATPLLREAVEAGVLDVTADGGHWFHHPLQAEALESGLAAEERRQLHAAFARVCEADLDADGATDPAARLAAASAVAEHHQRAGHDADAYRWTLCAADLATDRDDGAAALVLLRRLVELRERVEDVAESRRDLLDRLRRAAAAEGSHEAELDVVETLLGDLDETVDPLAVAELVVRREHLRFSTGRGFLRVEPMRRAVELTTPEPASWQHAFALAELAHASLWADDPTAPGAAAAALERATTVGHPRALAYAYAAASMAAGFSGSGDGEALGARGVENAAVARDWWGFVHASLWEANGADVWATPTWAHLVGRRREQLESLGGPHPYLAWMSADEAGTLLGAGDWKGCGERLRVAFGSDPGAAADVTARLTAARMAAYQGRHREAEEHLARADELFAETTDFLAFEFDAVRAQVRLASGDPEGAYAAAMAGALSPGVPPTLCEWLCPLGARALADLALAARSEHRSPEVHLRRLDELVARFPRVIVDSVAIRETYTTQLDGLDALYAAEVARARRSPDGPPLWRRAAGLLDGVWPWDAAYAAFRAGESLLLSGGSREEAAGLLRRSAGLAAELGAEPVLREVVDLARSARVRLDEVATRGGGSASGDAGLPGLPGLTTREREILDHVVAGRTYGEIARALFVSEKTVSSHVSNLLRKTGAANRVELARLARSASDRPAPG
ncbi:AAA family ATPase [Oryzobacter telluris]|uniref:helix-turn-helix transcriptional regulator n=1 Tax=Oryzobacter telluris TaxID=3149179 RepID=UPI00370D2F0B